MRTPLKTSIVTLVLGCTQTFYGSLYRPVPVPQCRLADSLLGSTREAAKGHVFAWYDTSADTTRIVAHNATDRETIQLHAEMPHHGPLVLPQAQMVVFLSHRAAHTTRDGPRQPEVRYTIDDSPPVGVGQGLVGDYHGPAADFVIPVTLPLEWREFLAVARAHRVVAEIGDSVQYTLTDKDRQNVAALYALLVCGSR